MSAPRASWRRGAAAAFLVAQLAVPGVLLLRRGEAPTDFAWDMFSHRMVCKRLEAYGGTRDGHIVPLPIDGFVPTVHGIRRTLFPGRLRDLESFMCANARVEGSPITEVALVARCASERNGTPETIGDAKRRECP